LLQLPSLAEMPSPSPVGRVAIQLKDEIDNFRWAAMNGAALALRFNAKGSPERAALMKLMCERQLKTPSQLERLASAKPLGKAGAMGQVYKLASGEVAKVR
jgi:hypothetical protein